MYIPHTGPDGSMSQMVGLPKNSYKPITNTAWVRVRLCKLQKWCTRLAAASDKVYQLLAHGRWFSPGTLASSTTKTGHDIAEILLKEALCAINQSVPDFTQSIIRVQTCACQKKIQLVGFSQTTRVTRVAVFSNKIK